MGQGPHLACCCCIPGTCTGLTHSRCSASTASGWGLLCTGGWSLLMPFLPKGQQQNQVILNEVAISWHSQSPPFPLALIHFLIDFSGFVCQLVSGRAGSKMTESHGLEGLFSGFYLLDFMRLEPRLPLSWRNVETILNPRTWTGDKRTLVTPLLPIPLVLSPRQGGTLVL